jgi:Domain of Unknown Function (DUF928)
MFAALSKMILFPAVIILLTVSVAIAAESSKASATTATPVYKPPKRGAPASRVGGGARGAEAGSLVLSVLAPEHTGWTAKDQPTLYWYISEPANTRVELTVIDDAAIAPLLETHLEPPSKAGVQYLRLADHNVHLKEGMKYPWSVALVRDPGQRSQDIVASGTLTYVKPSAELKQKLTQVDKEALASIYAGEGYWYDAIESLSELIEAQPQDKRLRELRASLLEQVALPEVAEYDRK